MNRVHTMVLTLAVLWAAATPSLADMAPVLRELDPKLFAYFAAEADLRTGLVKDRAGNFAPDEYTVASIAATGFGLAVLAVGAERGWIAADEARSRAERTLRYIRDDLPHEHGWFYHFVDMRDGSRVWNCEVSSIDTALLIAGALVAGQYFAGTKVQRLADDVYGRVDFEWMLTDGGSKPKSLTLSHGWTPEKGFIQHRWDSYSEATILYLLGMGSPTHPIPTKSWNAWKRPTGSYAGHRTFRSGPLFTHQFSHAFVDFRSKRDAKGHDYWSSSVAATLANRQFCADHSALYGAHLWGLSACDGPDGYRAYSAPPGRVEHDGTVAPLAVAASIVFAPELVTKTLAHVRATYGSRVWGRYGFSDAFSPSREWWDQDTIGIDVGAALLMLANHRDELVWRLFMGVPAVQRGMRLAGFRAIGEGR
ncbi:hypothetical protein FJZ36_08695 [Candidatus Poribacteria bacterium]|nr:hypothetical protein [Candidatus Poribacteria bacterium]